MQVPLGQSLASPSSATCPGPAGAAAPRSSGRSAATSGSNPPLRSGTCTEVAQAPVTGGVQGDPDILEGAPAFAGQNLDAEVPRAVRALGWGTAHSPGRRCSGDGPLAPLGGVLGEGQGEGPWAPCMGGSTSSAPTLALGSHLSWMNSSRAAHSDTSWGRPLLSATKDRMGSRSSAPLLGRRRAGQEAPGTGGAAQSPQP